YRLERYGWHGRAGRRRWAPRSRVVGACDGAFPLWTLTGLWLALNRLTERPRRRVQQGKRDPEDHHLRQMLRRHLIPPARICNRPANRIAQRIVQGGCQVNPRKRVSASEVPLLAWSETFSVYIGQFDGRALLWTDDRAGR